MTQENVEIVRRAIDAYNRGQDALDLFDPKIEWVTTGRFVEPDTYRGHEEVRRYLQALRDDFEELHVEPHELVNAGDHVIAPVRFTGRGRLSSAPIDLEFTFVLSLRDTLVLDGLTGHDQDLLASARLVAADLYNAFGSTEVRHITAEGKLRIGHFRGDTQQLQQLAGERGVVLTDEGVPGE